VPASVGVIRRQRKKQPWRGAPAHQIFHLPTVVAPALTVLHDVRAANLGVGVTEDLQPHVVHPTAARVGERQYVRASDLRSGKAE
jgi:hypothetical protein